MQPHWKTLAEVVLDHHLTLREAQEFVDEANCPKAFKSGATLYFV